MDKCRNMPARQKLESGSVPGSQKIQQTVFGKIDKFISLGLDRLHTRILSQNFRGLLHLSLSNGLISLQKFFPIYTREAYHNTEKDFCICLEMFRLKNGHIDRTSPAMHLQHFVSGLDLNHLLFS